MSGVKEMRALKGHGVAWRSLIKEDDSGEGGETATPFPHKVLIPLNLEVAQMPLRDTSLKLGCTYTKLSEPTQSQSLQWCLEEEIDDTRGVCSHTEKLTNILSNLALDSCQLRFKKIPFNM